MSGDKLAGPEEPVYRRSFDIGTVEELTRRALLDARREATAWRNRAVRLADLADRAVALADRAPGGWANANAARSLIAEARRARTIELTAQKRSAAHIALKLGITPERVRQYRREARKLGKLPELTG